MYNFFFYFQDRKGVSLAERKTGTRARGGEKKK